MTEARPSGPSGGAATPTIGPSGPTEPERRAVALRLARLHLRLGSLGLARAELEALAGSGELDEPALLDLAEVRWRTGDLPGAGEAANAALSTGDESVLALVIAAEAAAAASRPAEARRLAGRALERSEVALEALFAGMPRSGIWPHDVAEETSVAAPAGAGEASAGSGAPSPRVRPSVAGHPVELPPAELGIAGAAVDADALLGRASGAIAGGYPVEAGTSLSLVLRFASARADEVLATLERAEPAGLDAGLEIVRADALAALGRMDEARAAYRRALALVSSPRTP